MLSPPGSNGEVFVFTFDELLDLQVLVNGSLAMADLYDFLDNNQLHIGS